MNELPEIVLYAGLLIGLAFGAVGLLSGFCLLSSLRGLWSEGDGTAHPHLRARARGGDRRHAGAGGGRLRRPRQVDLPAAVVLAGADPVRRPPLRLRHGAGEWLRLARRGAARPRQSALAGGGDGHRRRRPDDAEGPDRARAPRLPAGDDADARDRLAAGAALVARVSAQARRRRSPSSRWPARC